MTSFPLRLLVRHGGVLFGFCVFGLVGHIGPGQAPGGGPWLTDRTTSKASRMEQAILSRSTRRGGGVLRKFLAHGSESSRRVRTRRRAWSLWAMDASSRPCPYLALLGFPGVVYPPLGGSPAPVSNPGPEGVRLGSGVGLLFFPPGGGATPRGASLLYGIPYYSTMRV
jgi:hypothetical protein